MFSCVVIGAAAAASSSPTKRRYVPDTQDIDVVKRMKLNEVELTDRNTVLRGVKQSASRSISTMTLDLFLVELFVGPKSDQ
jgi:parafibromin